MAKSNSIELSPLRSLDDFLLGSARFQLPNYRDMEKWGNRVVQNLLYYQTNYFLMSIIMILVVTVLHPVKMACGGLTILLMYALFSFLMNSTSSVTRLKKDYPFLGICLMIGGACLMVYMLGSLLVFLFGILLPISATFIHASLRLRNIMNKLSTIERVVSNRTPMGVFLESLEINLLNIFIVC
ncbi:pra1 protein, putative [Pediculus humanus corporis]|uniref:PRA1 family protein n=1 Tax=Pediculus humanus subsp. corporis TaxID=121224 RepID=E0VWW2_PEDHC|nr:pra1 protein, putative [Pediculus humanus corporis]EEB17868.1 pra1 protein, putative [Pediculus humanus corporis]